MKQRVSGLVAFRFGTCPFDPKLHSSIFLVSIYRYMYIQNIYTFVRYANVSAPSSYLRKDLFTETHSRVLKMFH